MKRRRRLVTLASYLLIGGIVMQWGACWIMGANTLAPGVTSLLVDSNGHFLGLINVCGVPNVLVTDDPATLNGTLLNAEDDLVTVCPFTVVSE
jgi:hypothetical protein